MFERLYRRLGERYTTKLDQAHYLLASTLGGLLGTLFAASVLGCALPMSDAPRGAGPLVALWS